MVSVKFLGLSLNLAGIIKNSIMISMVSKKNWNGILATAIFGLILVAFEIFDFALKAKVPYTTLWKVIKIAVIVQELTNSILMLRFYSLRHDNPPSSLQKFGVASSAILLIINVFVTLTAFYILLATFSSVRNITDEQVLSHTGNERRQEFTF